MAHYVHAPVLAPVLPLGAYRNLLDQNTLVSYGFYHLMLAHHCVASEENLKTTADVAGRFLQYGSFAHVIMDNSLVETGGAVDDKMILEACNTLLGPKSYKWNESIRVTAVLPDVMGDGESSREATEQGFYRWSNDPAWRNVDFMYVAQGCGWDDFLLSLDHFSKLQRSSQRIRMLAIPRVLRKTLGSRVKTVQAASLVVPSSVQIHLLGFSDDIADDILAAISSSRVRGIDSAVPYRINAPIGLASHAPARNPDWLEKGTLNEHALPNHNTVNRWLLGGAHGQRASY